MDVDARREAAVDVVLETWPRPRLPSMISLHERMPNSRCASDIVRRATAAGMNGPA